MPEKLYVLDMVASDPSDGFVDAGVAKPYIEFDDSTDPPSARMYLPLSMIRNYLLLSGTLTIASGVLTVPGPGVYIVQPETGLTDVLDQIVDTCQIGEIITLLTDPNGFHLCLITIDSGSHNINTPLGEDIVLGHTAIGGVASTMTICQLIKCQTASPAGGWYVIGSGGTNDYGWMTGDLRHSGAKVGFFGTPGGASPSIVQPDAYTPSNVTPDRSFDANNTSMDEIADILGTVIADLKAYGLFK